MDGPLTDTRKEYNNALHRLIVWLLDSTSSIGYDPGDLLNLPQHPDPSSSSALTTTITTTTTKRRTTIALSPQSLLHVAEKLSNHNPPFRTPNHILTDLDKCYTLRRLCAHSFLSNGSPFHTLIHNSHYILYDLFADLLVLLEQGIHPRTRLSRALSRSSTDSATERAEEEFYNVEIEEMAAWDSLVLSPVPSSLFSSRGDWKGGPRYCVQEDRRGMASFGMFCYRRDVEAGRQVLRDKKLEMGDWEQSEELREVAIVAGAIEGFLDGVRLGCYEELRRREEDEYDGGNEEGEDGKGERVEREVPGGYDCGDDAEHERPDE